MRYKKHIELICPYCFRKAGFHDFTNNGIERYRCKNEDCKRSYRAVGKQRIMNIQEAKNNGLLLELQNKYFKEQVEIIERLDYIKSVLDYIKNKLYIKNVVDSLNSIQGND